MKITEKNKLFWEINSFELFFCLDETTINLIPSRDFILIILQTIYKKICVFPAKNMLISPQKRGKSPFSPAASKVYVPPPGGKLTVFFGKVIECTSGSKLPPLVSGEFFGPRVEKNMLKH